MYQFIVFKNVILNIITDYYQLFCCLKNISGTRLEAVCLVCAQSHPTLRFHWNAARQAPLSMDSPGEFPLEWESFQPRDRTRVSGISCIGRWILYPWATWNAPSSCRPVEFCSVYKAVPQYQAMKEEKWWNFYLLLEKFLNSFGELKQSCWRTTNEGLLVVELRLHCT